MNSRACDSEAPAVGSRGSFEIHIVDARDVQILDRVGVFKWSVGGGCYVHFACLFIIIFQELIK